MGQTIGPGRSDRVNRQSLPAGIANRWFRRAQTNGFAGQWAMVLSGAQSALAGGFFVLAAGTMPNPGIALIAGYAAFGAVYFLVTAVWLSLREARQVRAGG